MTRMVPFNSAFAMATVVASASASAGSITVERALNFQVRASADIDGRNEFGADPFDPDAPNLRRGYREFVGEMLLLSAPSEVIPAGAIAESVDVTIDGDVSYLSFLFSLGREGRYNDTGAFVVDYDITLNGVSAEGDTTSRSVFPITADRTQFPEPEGVAAFDVVFPPLDLDAISANEPLALEVGEGRFALQDYTDLASDQDVFYLRTSTSLSVSVRYNFEDADPTPNVIPAPSAAIAGIAGLMMLGRRRR